MCKMYNGRWFISLACYSFFSLLVEFCISISTEDYLLPVFGLLPIACRPEGSNSRVWGINDAGVFTPASATYAQHMTVEALTLAAMMLPISWHAVVSQYQYR